MSFEADTRNYLSSIDGELARLTAIRQQLADLLKQAPAMKSPTKKAARKTVKRVLSAEARAKIAAAQKKRWAAQRKAAKRN